MSDSTKHALSTPILLTTMATVALGFSALLLASAERWGLAALAAVLTVGLAIYTGLTLREARRGQSATRSLQERAFDAIPAQLNRAGCSPDAILFGVDSLSAIAFNQSTRRLGLIEVSGEEDGEPLFAGPYCHPLRTLTGITVRVDGRAVTHTVSEPVAHDALFRVFPLVAVTHRRPAHRLQEDDEPGVQAVGRLTLTLTFADEVHPTFELVALDYSKPEPIDHPAVMHAIDQTVVWWTTLHPLIDRYAKRAAEGSNAEPTTDPRDAPTTETPH